MKPKPPRLPYAPERIDALRTAGGDLCSKPIFTVWEWVYDKKNDRWTKKPKHAAGTRGVTFDAALSRFNADATLAGLGVKLGPIPGSAEVLFGVDYDGAEKGPLPAAWPTSDSYAERSPSGGDKFHVLGLYTGAALEGKRKGSIEIYSEGRFFTLTGERINGARILPTDPRPFYAAIGINDPQPYQKTAGAKAIPAAPIAEANLTDRERKLLEQVRGMTDYATPSDRDWAAICELMKFGATDEEAHRIICAAFWRDKLHRNKGYLSKHRQSKKRISDYGRRFPKCRQCKGGGVPAGVGSRWRRATGGRQPS
jgi:hypothetical protein